VETIYLGDRRIQIRTSVLEEKSTACNMLCCYADELKEGFLPWVQQVRAVLPQVLRDLTVQCPCQEGGCIGSECVRHSWALHAPEDTSAAL
jgi:hypothetical protein